MFLISSWFLFIWVPLVFLWLLRRLYNLFLGAKWEAAERGEVADFCGAYRVYILPRWLFFWFLDTKHIECEGSSARPGFNRAYGFIKCGEFHVVESATQGVYLFYSRWMRDRLRKTGPGRYLGKLYLRFWKFRIFVFWFWLIEIGE